MPEAVVMCRVPATWQTQVDVPVQLVVTVSVPAFDESVVDPLPAVQVDAPKQARGSLSVLSNVCRQFVTVYVPSALKVTSPASASVTSLSTEHSDSSFAASMFEHAPRNLQVPTTSP